MRKNRERILNYATYKRFIFSFLLVLFLPLIGFVFLFTYNFREIYYNNIIAQAEKSLEMVGQDLKRNLEDLESIVYYNSTNEKLTKVYIQKDYHGEKVRLALATAMATNNMLYSVAYYNDAVPQMIYTDKGTFSVYYYARLYAGDKGHEAFLDELERADGAPTWLMWENVYERIIGLNVDGQSEEKQSEEVKSSLQYVVKSGNNAWWIFTISPSVLDDVIYTEDAVTVLLDQDGSILYESGSIDISHSYRICYTEPNDKFQLVRYMDEDILFADFEKWQLLFLVVVLVVVFLGGVLTVALTLYNGHPFVEFLAYCRNRLKDIPENVDEIEIFYLALNELENQMFREEKKYRINSILLHMLYGREEDTGEFKAAIKEEGIFENAIAFRVILIAGLKEDEAYLQMLHLYFESLLSLEYYLIDIRPKKVMVMIAGMSTYEENNFEELTYIANQYYEETGEEICFYLSGKCKDISKIHNSYLQALSCRQDNVDNGEEKVYYYKSKKSSNEKQENVQNSLDTYDYKDDLILKVRAFIEENSRSSELNANMVAGHFGMSASLLSQRFKKQMHVNISDYINEKKFSYACELLLETDYSVKEITELIGYSHPVSFIRKFKQLYGVTPIEYRENKM